MATRFPALEIVLLGFQIPGIRDRLVTLQLGSTFGIFPDVDFLTVSFREKWMLQHAGNVQMLRSIPVT
jgi:hypothetical protein